MEGWMDGFVQNARACVSHRITFAISDGKTRMLPRRRVVSMALVRYRTCLDVHDSHRASSSSEREMGWTSYRRGGAAGCWAAGLLG